MLNRINPALYGAGRVLPLRNEQFPLSAAGALALRLPAFALPASKWQAGGQIWFTPEAIIWDAISVLNNLLWLWCFFRSVVSRFALRALIIACFIFLIASFSDSDNLVAANTYNGSPYSITNKQSAALPLKAKLVASASPIFTWPVEKTYITSRFSYWHKGIDIPNPYGTPVRPSAVGTVVLGRQ